MVDTTLFNWSKVKDIHKVQIYVDLQLIVSPFSVYSFLL